MNSTDVDLPLDLGGEDDDGLPWGFVADARDVSKVTEGAWIIVGSSLTQAVAQVVDVSGGVVHVRALPGSVARHRSLLTN
jgi:hypothetical protein